MAAKIDNDCRIQSILSTLEILDGQKKKKTKYAKKQIQSLRNPTFSSASKTQGSLSGGKESKMVPRAHARDNKDKVVGKYSTFLAQIVADPSSKQQRPHWKRERKDDLPFNQDHGPGGVEQENSRKRRDTPRLSLADESGTSGNNQRFQGAEVVQTGKRVMPSINQKQCKPIPLQVEDGTHLNDRPEQTEEGNFTSSSSSNPRWQQIIKSRLKPKQLGDAVAPRVAEVAKTKIKSRRNRLSSSDLDKSEEDDSLNNHLSSLKVINAAIAFKRQRFRKQRQERKLRISRLFRVVARLIVIIKRICEVHFVERGTEDVEISFAQLVSTRQRTDLMFDVTEYRAKRKWQLMSETKRILQKSTRSEQDVQHIETTLREMSALGEYPASMQRSIARVGWYESYGPNRVIVREGHMPDAFYFILSGSAIVSVPLADEAKPKILAILLRGDSFGELAILNQSKRTSTVTTRENVEMFVISAEDFTKIVMSGNNRMLQDPQTMTFMRSVEFLKGWPLKKIENNPKKCVFNFFRKDTVLVRDSRLSEWIYVVKSGSCSVLKQLKYVEPKLNPKKERTNKDERMTSSRHRQLLLDRERSFMNRRMIAAHAQRESLYKRGMDLPYLMMNEEITERLAPNRNRSNTILAGEDGTENIEEEKREEKWMDELEEGGVLNDMKDSLLYPLIEVEKEDEELSPKYGPQRTFAHDLNQRALQSKESTKMNMESMTDSRPVFVCIQTLQKGGVFGLVDVLFSEQPSLSLISNGAECMVMSKHFFLQHANDDMLHRVKISMMPFAKEDEIQRSLENQLKWEVYRTITMETTLTRMQMKKFYTK
nr:uncharacterized protein LOC129276279 isoform X1 [Lytechinus pictus]